VFLILIFSITAVTLTSLYINSQEKLFETQKELVFYKLYNLSYNLIEEIFKEYNNNIENLKKANTYVVNHLNENIYDLQKKLGKNYHIFITDTNFTIKQTTFKYDKNFSLAFAKDIITKHTNYPGTSLPICEPATSEFFMYSDRFINNRVIQVGYIILSPKIKALKEEIKKLKEKNPFIKNISLIIIHPKSRYAQKCNIIKPLGKKYTLNEMIEIRKNGFKLYKKLLKQNPIFTKNGMYILGKTPSGVNEMIFALTIDPQVIHKKIQKIIIIAFSFLIAVTVLLITLFIYINRYLKNINNFAKNIKEEKTYHKNIDSEMDEVVNAYNKTLKKLQDSVKSKEDFLHYAAHELATPINILTLYMDEYEELRPSIKKLLSSYKNISYFLQSRQNDNKETFNLAELIKDRIEYFRDILNIENKTIKANLKPFYIKADKNDIETLIDNNIKNAIKYSTGNEILITLKDNILSFENEGIIKDKQKVFDKFYREEDIKGGFGIGLSIIKSIAQKYDISINLTTQNNKVKFEYIFKGKNENSGN